ncbi:MAG: DUF1343 domain-containing protein [Ruminococcaceae bacterium]|nr:DUF1343 domain-containing protein [Oscillospiraceae bacterium]
MKKTVYCGADVLAGDGRAALARLGLPDPGKCGLITNPTGVLRNMTSTVDMLRQVCDLRALFGPEHGVRGDAQAGGEVESFYTDPATGLPVYSYYGKGAADAAKVMAELDTVFFDIQDIGARFYTYQYTMTDAMIHCAASGVRFVVLDRPNPIGGTKAEGTILDRRFSTFVGRYPTATRSGLTVGEFARMINETEKIGCSLTVVPCEGWERHMDFDDTDLCFIQPSPNLPTVDTAYSYIGTCIFEGTNLSEGRGTTKPFEMIGAPWVDVRALLDKMGEQPGVYLREAYFTPTFSKHAGQLCRGVQLHIHDREAYRPFETGLRLFCALRSLHPEETQTRSFITNLLGTDDVLRQDFEADAYIAREGEKVADWQEMTKVYYLY